MILSDEPEHLHDPPLLKYIPHLWPGGGVGHYTVDGGGDGAGVTVDHGGDTVGNGDYDGDGVDFYQLVLFYATTGDGAGVTVDHGGDSVGNGDYDGGELGMEVMVLW